MKYKLINKQTNEEHLCDKVTIDGYDYYVSDEIIKDVRPYKGQWQIEKGYILNKFPTYLTDLSECRLVIATNNPNINTSKVVDEVERLANWATEETQSSRMKRVWKSGYNKSQETHPFSEEDMIEFYEWCNYPIYRADGELGFRSRVQAQFPEYNTYVVIDETGYSIHPKGVFLTTEELLQLWKEQKPKIVYYE